MKAAPSSAPALPLETLQLQRDQALACFVLTLATVFAVFLSVFSDRSREEIEEARQKLASHDSQFEISKADLRQNQDALREVRAALKNMKPALPR